MINRFNKKIDNERTKSFNVVLIRWNVVDAQMTDLIYKSNVR